MQNGYNLEEIKPRKWLQVLLIIIALVIVVILANRALIGFKNFKHKLNNFSSSHSSVKNVEIEKKAFNSKFEIMIGSDSGFSVKELLDITIMNNKKNKEHLVMVKYNDVTTSNPDEILEMKKEIGEDDEFETSLDYDDAGFVNQLTIILVKKDDTEIESFNSSLEFWSGTQYGNTAEHVIDEVIKSNNKNKEHLISVSFASTNTSDVTELKNLKSKLSDWTKYEISVSYDADGYINKITIENR